MQHEITKPQHLLDSSGNIAEPGFAKTMLWRYSREAIKAPKGRIKEWDYYYIGTQDYGLALTISDAGFVSCVSASLLEFGEKPAQMTDSEIGPLPMGRLNLPPSSERGGCYARVGTSEFTFKNDGKTRHLFGTYDNFGGTRKCLVFDIVLTDIPPQSMVIATPFKKDKHFYYNQKINCMRAEGFFEFNGKKYPLNRQNEALATLDWGRGVWTYNNTWYWGSGQMVLDGGKTFGFNLGYGFGDTSAASENMLFYDGTSHKLEDVKFEIPKRGKKFDYMSPWRFTSSDGRFEASFKPVIDRCAPFDLKVVCMIPHQVFGKMTGYGVLDDGTKIEFRDKLVFAERVHNKW